MSAQAEQMKGFVNHLEAMVGRGSENAPAERRRLSDARKRIMPARETKAVTSAPTATGGVEDPRMKKEVRPEQVIPLDDASLDDF
jgi:hypothetical protein